MADNTYATVDVGAVAIGGAGNLPATNELPVDMHGSILKAYPDLTPITAILTKLGVDKAHNFRVDWQEEKAIPSSLVVSAACASGGATVSVVANGDTVPKFSCLFNPRSYDIALVTADGTSNTLTITKSSGGTTGAAWNAGDVLYVMLPAVDEDNDAEYSPHSIADENVYNYVQLVRMQFSTTRIMDRISTHFGGAGSKRLQLKRQKYREVREKWELMNYFGGRASSGTAPDSTRMMGGFLHYLKDGTLYKDFNGAFTESGFDNLIGDYYDQNPDSRRVICACAPNVIRKINGFAKDQIRISPNSKRYGLNLRTYIGGPTDVDLVPLPLLRDTYGRGIGFMLDLERIRMKTLDGLTFYGDAKGVGQSERIYDLYRLVTSLLIGNESRHAMFVGARA